uniref:ULP_PROTEASE domain-containing protein n=2 Tax=Caenorhabditis tropicalis TaxID=1561998 RepID=A0A1I7U109_9PELO
MDEKMNLIEYKQVIFPMCTSKHWILICLDLINKRIEVFDSVYCPLRETTYQNGEGDPIKCMRQWGENKEAVNGEEAMNFSTWPVYYMQNIPRQENGYDCGIFTCQYAERLSRGMLFEICEKKIIPLEEFDQLVNSPVNSSNQPKAGTGKHRYKTTRVIIPLSKIKYLSSQPGLENALEVRCPIRRGPLKRVLKEEAQSAKLDAISIKIFCSR